MKQVTPSLPSTELVVVNCQATTSASSGVMKAPLRPLPTPGSKSSTATAGNLNSEKDLIMKAARSLSPSQTRNDLPVEESSESSTASISASPVIKPAVPPALRVPMKGRPNLSRTMSSPNMNLMIVQHNRGERINMRKQALRMNMMRMHSMRLPSNPPSLLASASNSEAEGGVNDTDAADRKARSESPKKSDPEEKKAPRQLAGRKKKKRAARAAGQPPPPPDEAPITPMKKSSRSKSVPAVSRKAGTAPASPHTPSKQHKLRMQQGLVPAPPPPPPLISGDEDEKVSPKPAKAKVTSKLAGTKEKRKSKKPASSEEAATAGDGEIGRSVNKTRSVTAGTRATAVPTRRERGTRPPPPTNSNKRQLSTRTLSTASRTSSGKSEASAAGTSPTSSNSKILKKPVRRTRSRDDQTTAAAAGVPDAAPNPPRRRSRKSTSPERRGSRKSTSPERRGSRKSTSPERRGSRKSTSPVRRGTKAPATPRTLPRKMPSLDSENKSTKKLSAAANTKSALTKSKSGGLPARSFSNNSETAGRAGGALKKKGVFGSMRSLIKSPKPKPSKEKAPAPMVEEVMEVDIM